MDEDLTKVLEAIARLVDRDEHWNTKVSALKQKAAEMGEHYQSSLEEFFSWDFPDEE